MKILNSKPRQDNSVILFQKGFCQQTDKNQSFIELVLGAGFRNVFFSIFPYDLVKTFQALLLLDFLKSNLT